MSKRSLYGRYCFELGYNVVYTNAKGSTKFTLRENDDDAEIPQWPSGSEPAEKAASWWSFRLFWKNHYPKLVVAKPREDICGDCYIFANAFRFMKRATTSDDESMSDDSTHSQTEEAGGVDTDVEALKREDLVKKAALHVERAVAQREFVNQHIDKAKSDKEDNVPHGQRTYTFVADYCQNFGLPHFGGEQPGETYYYSPVNVNCFGVVDVTNNNHLHAFVYDEGTGKKGGNNVASLVMELLKSKGLLGHSEGRGANLC